MNAFLRFLDTDIQNNPQKTRPFNIQHSTFNIQHSTFNIQHSTFNIQHSTFNIQHSTFNIQQGKKLVTGMDVNIDDEIGDDE
ncbi:hypothetical protein GFK39_23155 [Escherichia coli]|nr:hypothetical protein [Escherichia coli]CSW62160.1 putative regulator PrlF [Shigella sonnei]SRJ45639.1 putative regulator PrlF [Shigella sonnei]